jgi:hypothetical protein
MTLPIANGVFGSTEAALPEVSLFPAIRETGNDTLIVAPGTRCRRQIADRQRVRAYHPVEVMGMATELQTLRERFYQSGPHIPSWYSGPPSRPVTRPVWAHAAGRRAGISLPRINPADNYRPG